MLLQFVEIKNFRKLKSCRIDLSDKETVFVGANNSGKTSAMDALILFLKTHALSTREFTLSNWREINQIGKSWLELKEGELPDLAMAKWEEYLPQLDVWLTIKETEYHYVSELIPTLEWKGGSLGVRFRFQPKSIELLHKEFVAEYRAARKVMDMARKDKGDQFLNLWPKNLWDFLERRLKIHFGVAGYLLDAAKLVPPVDGVARPQVLDEGNLPFAGDPFKGLIKIDIINAQRGFSDPGSDAEEAPKTNGNLSTQLREYYSKHLNPYDQPEIEDLEALMAIEQAKLSFDDRLEKSFSGSIKELEGLNYPGFGGNPSIKISSKINAIDGLNHASAVTFELFKGEGVTSDYPLSLPEKYNGLGYQNLISMVFKLIRFRDEWMQVGKIARANTSGTEELEFQPLHLVLVEEPEAHLHAQVQQVFIRKAYEVLRTSDLLTKYKHFNTQLVVSTHSNHIAHEIKFTSLRYFKRRPAEKDGVPFSTVVNLSKTFGSEDETTKFAIRYLKTTHCDLFFADAVILVEGPAERMLVPNFIRRHYPTLASCYIALLEIGGSHAHTLRPLLQDLGIITLIITDIDSIDPVSGQSVIPEKNKNHESDNQTLKSWLPGFKELDKLLSTAASDKIDTVFPVRVAYQAPVEAKLLPADAKGTEVFPYTFEIALAFKNLAIFKGLTGVGLIKKFSEASKLPTVKEINESMYSALKNGKKAEFALELLLKEEPEQLAVPEYIAEGLEWLNGQLNNHQVTIK
jgi:predicted ATP-dependent endonuclease of OLD family